MKLRIQKDPTGLYFAQILGVQGAYAQGETPILAYTYLLDVYQKVCEIDQERKMEKIKENKMILNMKDMFRDTSFKKFELSF